MTGTVLVVDDVALVRQTLRQILKVGEYVVEEASDAETASKMVVERRYDLVILDHNLPGRDGVTLCEWMKSNPGTKEIPVIMCTGVSERSVVMRAIRAGAADYIVKPLDATVVLGKIKQVLENPGRRLGEPQ